MVDRDGPAAGRLAVTVTTPGTAVTDAGAPAHDAVAAVLLDGTADLLVPHPGDRGDPRKRRGHTVGRGVMEDMSTDRNTQTARAAVWATVFGGAGVLHFARHRFFDSIVPEELPGEQKYWTWGSGVLELALAAAIANPSTRAAAARPAALFLLGVWPGNIKMAVDWQRSKKTSALMKAGAWARVAAQVPMIASVAKLDR